MAAVQLKIKDRERFAQARKRGRSRSQDASALVDARYNPAGDTIDLQFRGGAWMMIPRRMIPGLEQAPAAQLQSINLSPAADALSWRSLDVDVYVPGLVERAFGSHLFATGPSGRRTSKAKPPRARFDGAKSARPPKRLTA